jgi:hypothetical protein
VVILSRLREVRKRLRDAIASRNLDRLNEAIRHHDTEADFEIIPYYGQAVELYGRPPSVSRFYLRLDVG